MAGQGTAALKNNPVKSGKRGGARPGAGRPKGSPNKITTQLKEMILQALDEADEGGSVAYLKKQATANPTAFLTLVGKVLPLTVAGSGDSGEIPVVHRVEIVGVEP